MISPFRKIRHANNVRTPKEMLADMIATIYDACKHSGNSQVHCFADMRNNVSVFLQSTPCTAYREGTHKWRDARDVTRLKAPNAERVAHQHSANLELVAQSVWRRKTWACTDVAEQRSWHPQFNQRPRRRRITKQSASLYSEATLRKESVAEV